MVRANLAYVGLRADMRQSPEPTDPDDVLNLRSSAYEMPRYKITNDPRIFSVLMKCLDLDTDTKKDANDLIL